MRDERGKTDLSSYDLSDGPTRRASSAWVQPFFSLVRIAVGTSSMTWSWAPNNSLDKPAVLPRISTYWLWMLKVYGTSLAPRNMNFPSTPKGNARQMKFR
jgi:hypothetical protein